MKTVIERLSALRALMKNMNLWAYIVPSSDPHMSEYLAAYWEGMQWLSGFKGEAGTLVVTLSEAFLWTDSRFYLQAQMELQNSSILLMRASDDDCPSVEQWLAQNKPNGACTVGIDPAMYSYANFQQLKAHLSKNDITLHSTDLIKPIWSNRPAFPNSQLYVYSDDYAGETAQSKLERVRAAMKQHKADVLVTSALDEIAWLLNVRGADVQCNPVFCAYLVIEKQKCVLFAYKNKIADASVQEYLANVGVEIQDYDAITPYLNALTADAIMFDGKMLNEALFEAFNPAIKRVINEPSPIQVIKSMKNSVEIAGEKQAMIYDAVALTKFFKWLEEALAQNTPLTECDLVKKLRDFCQEQPSYVMDSFGTIAGFGANGAIVHYAPKKDSCARIEKNGVLLLDSGRQYFEGTTDITRTVWLGDKNEIPTDVKRDYTLVMKGHIALARAKFLKGTRGNQLAVLAQQFMWQEGITYLHGTGHGVGHFLGCHEGPMGFKTDNNPSPLYEGNVLSDEPGIYREGKYGIRIENLITVVPATHLSPQTTGETYYQFETITLCYYDTNLLDKSMLTMSEKEWINNYHQKLYTKIAPLLTQEEANFLAKKCEMI